jgi:hypothetical protein
VPPARGIHPGKNRRVSVRRGDLLEQAELLIPESGVFYRLFRHSGWLLGVVEDMQFLARLEADGFTRGDVHLGSGPGIPADSGLPRPHIEHAEASKLNAVAIRERFLEAFKNGVDCSLGLHTRQSRAFDYVMDDVLFNQCLHPETLKNFWATSMLV